MDLVVLFKIGRSIMCLCLLLQILQHDMWGVPDTDRHDWPGLRKRIAK